MNRLENNTVKPEKSHIQLFNSAFSREITVALAVKFLLLGLLWWLFFAVNKQPVNSKLVADKLLGSGQFVFPSANPQEKP